MIVIPQDGWAISHDTHVELWRHLERYQPKRILETGSGYSTLLFASTGADVVALEHDPHYADLSRVLLAEHDLDARIIHAPIVGPGLAYATSGLDPDERFDFLFIDGPPASIGRGSVLPTLRPWLNPEAVVILDDAYREAESEAWEQWQRGGLIIHQRRIPTDRGMAVGIVK